MKRKASILSLVLIAASICYAVYLPTSLILDIQDRRSELILEREVRLTLYMNAAKALYRAGADQDLTQLLRDALKHQDISYFAIYRNQQLRHIEPLQSPLAGGHAYEERAPLAGKDLIDSVRSERSEFLSTDTLLTIGIDKRTPNLIWVTITNDGVWKVILQDIIVVIALAALIFWLHTRDLSKLRKEIERTGRMPTVFNRYRPLSAESEAIVAGLAGYEANEKELKARHDRLHSQVLPALKRELFSGQAPPYTFECTLVRTDINGFSAIFNSRYRDRFAEHIDDFFVGLTEIVSRYDGLIHEFVGDEAIFYFKDVASQGGASNAGPASSINRAVDAIRDIHELAREIHGRTALEGHRFTVKSALAHGTLRFGKQVDGYSLSGGILIETVRILSTVTDKDENYLYFGSRHQEFLRNDHRSESVGAFSLKGYANEVQLLRWTGSMTLAESLERSSTAGFGFISRHRSDAHLLQIIDTATSNIEKWTIDKHLAVIQELRLIEVFRARQSLAPALTAWLEAASHTASAKLISAIVMLYPNLVPKDALSDRDIARLEGLLDSNDMRTVANVVEVLRRYEVVPVARSLSTLAASDNNRIAANALIHAGSRELDRKILKTLDTMIFSRTTDDGRRSSAIFAAGEIARLLKARDPVYFSTRVEFQKLLKQIIPFCSHSNESVATQASRALAKAGIPIPAENSQSNAA